MKNENRLEMFRIKVIGLWWRTFRKLRRKVTLRLSVRLGILLVRPEKDGAVLVYGELDHFSYDALVFPSRPPPPYREKLHSRIVRLRIIRETETTRVVLYRFSSGRTFVAPGLFKVLDDYWLLVEHLADAVFPLMPEKTLATRVLEGAKRFIFGK